MGPHTVKLLILIISPCRYRKYEYSGGSHYSVFESGASIFIESKNGISGGDNDHNQADGKHENA